MCVNENGEVCDVAVKLCRLARYEDIGSVEDFENAVDELRKRQWVSVKDRLPEREDDYLVYFDDGFIAITFYKKNGWELWADGDEPTHWMKLPEPPKEG